MKLNKTFEVSHRYKVIFWVVVISVLLYFRGISSQEGQTLESKQATWRNAFVSACVNELSKTQNNILGDGFCGCAYDKLNTMYPDFNTNQDRFRRILKEGYNRTETDSIVPCATQYKEV